MTITQQIMKILSVSPPVIGLTFEILNENFHSENKRREGRQGWEDM
jgi:hypothetical protein